MHRLSGVALALGGIVLWGLFPIYWKQLTHLNDFEVLMHRILWSVVFLALVLIIGGNRHAILNSFRPLKNIRILLASALMISFNWGIYIWAVGVDKVVEASMGYFLAPLMTVVLGLTVFKEQLSRNRKMAVFIAAAAVLMLFVARNVPPWLALSLAASFAAYNALRKIATQDSVVGLFVETLLLAPIALVILIWLLANGQAGFVQHDGTTVVLTLASGAVTTIPLILFVAGSRRMSLSGSGLLFYLTPTIQFLIGVFIYQEPLPVVDLAAFVAIWIALVIFAVDSYSSASRIPSSDPNKEPT